MSAQVAGRAGRCIPCPHQTIGAASDNQTRARVDSSRKSVRVGARRGERQQARPRGETAAFFFSGPAHRLLALLLLEGCNADALGLGRATLSFRLLRKPSLASFLRHTSCFLVGTAFSFHLLGDTALAGILRETARLIVGAAFGFRLLGDASLARILCQLTLAGILGSARSRIALQLLQLLFLTAARILGRLLRCLPLCVVVLRLLRHVLERRLHRRHSRPALVQAQNKSTAAD